MERADENGEHDENGDLELEPSRSSRRRPTRAPSAATGSAIRPRPGRRSRRPGFVEAARTIGVLILTHRRLLVSQFNRELKDEGYGDRIVPEITGTGAPAKRDPITIQTYAWFARHVGDLNREAYQLVICDEAHTALGEKTSAAIRSFPEPVFIGMTATEQLIAKQVSDVFPASVDDLPLVDAARRGLIAPLRWLRVPPAAAINSVPIVGGDFDQEALAKVLDHVALNQAAASLYRDRFDSTPGVVYAAGVEHAYNLAQEFRATGLKAEAVSGRTPPVQLAEILAAYELGEIDVLVNAMLLAEGWNSPRATVVMHLAPTASRRVYQQRIGRIMRMHPRKEAGVVVDFVQKGATHNDRVVTLHSLLGSDFYREGARVTPAPRRRVQRRARRKLAPAPWLVPVTPDVSRRLAVIQREWQRIDPRYLDEDEQRFWARIAGRQARFDDRVALFEKLTRAARARRRSSSSSSPARPRTRTAGCGRWRSPTGSACRSTAPSFDDLVTLVTQAPPWEKDRVQGVRILLRAIGEGRPEAPDQILARWTWRLARAVRKVLDRKASAEYPEAKRLLGALANSRGHRHEENAAKLAAAAKGLPIATAAALLASAEGYTPRANQTSRPLARSSAPSPRSRRRSPTTSPRRRRIPAVAAAAAGGRSHRGTTARRTARRSDGGRQVESPPAEEPDNNRCNNRAGHRVRITGDGTRDPLRVPRRSDHGGLAVRPARASDRSRRRASARPGAGRSRSSPGSRPASSSRSCSPPGSSTSSGCRRTCSGTSRSDCCSCSR